MTGPASTGPRLPAEWEPHAATWLAWPHRHDTWPGLLPQVTARFARMVHLLAEVEEVRILAGTEDVRRDAEIHVGRLDRIEILDIPTNDAWIRDYGPMFTVVGPPELGDSGHLEVVDWRFNAWGGKWPPWDLDDRVPQRIAEIHGHRHVEAPLVLEGGAVDTDGRGTLMTTTGCLLDDARNPDRGLDRLDATIRRYTGAQQILWLENAFLEGDDTDGHIDQLARFVSEGRVLVATALPEDDAHFSSLTKLRRQLEKARDATGRSLEITPLPLPAPRRFQGQRLPASYCNFYVANELVLVPHFDDPVGDERASNILREHFPERHIVGVPSVELVVGLGAIHCLTQPEWRVSAEGSTPVARRAKQANPEDWSPKGTALNVNLGQ